MSRWRITNIILVVLFAGMALFLWLRPYDGTGTANTVNVKLISFSCFNNLLCIYWPNRTNCLFICEEIIKEPLKLFSAVLLINDDFRHWPSYYFRLQVYSAFVHGAGYFQNWNYLYHYFD
ncbi:DUF3923 family protein [Lactobacillus melliventris]|uniref:DUF3923 family protein n=1 Tax=Lactobacillus melliventris TaxID=1218507 RepID=UPI00164F01A9|nr:DUF3923 family protein [Lactobacillus melliventris]